MGYKKRNPTQYGCSRQEIKCVFPKQPIEKRKKGNWNQEYTEHVHILMDPEHCGETVSAVGLGPGT